MKLSTLWSAYRQAETRKSQMIDFGTRYGGLSRQGQKALQQKIRQCDKLEKAIGQRIAATENKIQELEQTIEYNDYAAAEYIYSLESRQ